MTDDTPWAGDYQCVQLGKYPVVVVRDVDGQIQAFHHLCRHRGLVFMEGCGKAEREVRCPFHGWHHKLDGRMRAVPQVDELYPGMNKSELSL